MMRKGIGLIEPTRSEGKINQMEHNLEIARIEAGRPFKSWASYRLRLSPEVGRMMLDLTEVEPSLSVIRIPSDQIRQQSLCLVAVTFVC